MKAPTICCIIFQLWKQNKRRKKKHFPLLFQVQNIDGVTNSGTVAFNISSPNDSKKNVIRFNNIC